MRRGFGWESFAFGFGPRAWGFWGPRGGRRQWFGSGDMKYVILKLLNERPMHGYEVMKALEERLQGCYSPSPGTVYPTLQWLEDEGLVRSRELDAKKVYEITEAGKKFLKEHKDVIDDIFERVEEVLDDAMGPGMAVVHRAMGELLKSAYRAAFRAASDSERRRIAEILKRAAEEVASAGSA